MSFSAGLCYSLTVLVTMSLATPGTRENGMANEGWTQSTFRRFERWSTIRVLEDGWFVFSLACALFLLTSAIPACLQQMGC